MTKLTVGKIKKSTGMLGMPRRTFEVPAIFLDGEFVMAFTEGQDAEAEAVLAVLQEKEAAHAASGVDYAFFIN